MPTKNAYKIVLKTLSGSRVVFSGEADDGPGLLAKLKDVVQTLETGLAKEAEAAAAFAGKEV